MTDSMRGIRPSPSPQLNQLRTWTRRFAAASIHLDEAVEVQSHLALDDRRSPEADEWELRVPATRLSAPHRKAVSPAPGTA